MWAPEVRMVSGLSCKYNTFAMLMFGQVRVMLKLVQVMLSQAKLGQVRLGQVRLGQGYVKVSLGYVKLG